MSYDDPARDNWLWVTLRCQALMMKTLFFHTSGGFLNDYVWFPEELEHLRSLYGLIFDEMIVIHRCILISLLVR